MKPLLVSKTILLVTLTALLVSIRVEAGENINDAIEIVRAIYQGDRQALLAEKLELSESEKAGFWPLYRSYRADMDKLGDELVKLVLEYADYYPDVPEDRAARLLKRYVALEKKLVEKRAWYLKRAGKMLPAAKVLRWAQLENRMDLALRLQLAVNIPVIPADKSKP
jgi:hypothetical protein